MRMLLVNRTFAFCLFFILLCNDGFAQLKQELEEKKPAKIEIESLEREVVEKKEEKKIKKLFSSLELSSSYETNPRLTVIRKGDSSGHLKYSLFPKRLLFQGFLFSFNYDFDGTVYGEFNDLTNILNHTRFSFDKSLNKFLNFGTGYDFSSFYYPTDQGSDFYFHKGFVYFRHNITRDMYHQLMLEEGVKDYPHSRAYLDSTTTFQDSNRRDYRHGVEYSLGAFLMNKLFFRLRAKFSINDSNALFQDYYDYKSYDISPYFNYKISEKYSLSLSVMMTKTDYIDRLVNARTYARRDRIFNGNIGMRYTINKNNNVSLGYGYNESKSNDSSTEYSGSTINCGWQYKF